MKLFFYFRAFVSIIVSSLICGLMPLYAAAADSFEKNKLFAGVYKPGISVSDDQARIIYYREADGFHGKGSANVYLDRELVSSLQPGGHVEFCVSPGMHTLGAYLNDAHRYQGKTIDLYRATLNAGRTYYIKVREDGSTFPLAVLKEDAEIELKGSRVQAHLFNRSSRIEACRQYRFLASTVTKPRQYELLADKIFTRGAINDVGRAALSEIMRDLQQSNVQMLHVDIVGHTDPLGAESNNQRLGQEWADAVRQSLIESGAPQSLLKALSMGSRQPIKNSCYGSREEQLSCYAPNRRVVVAVETRSEN